MDYERFFFWLEGYIENQETHFCDIIKGKMAQVDTFVSHPPVWSQNPVQATSIYPQSTESDLDNSIFGDPEKMEKYLKDLPEESLTPVGDLKTQQPKIWTPAEKDEINT